MLLKVKDPKKVITLGLMALAVSGSVPFLLRHSGGLSENLVDGVHGALLGLAIGLLLMGIRMQARGHRCAEEI